jgi:putative restriction endonuclease
MKYWVGVTDETWFEYLAQQQPDEVNFWQPSGIRGFRAIEPGAPFLFKLHSPENYIVGGGFFVRHSILPLSIAWKAFAEKNGAPDYQTFQQQIFTYRKRRGQTEPDPKIGCIILTTPFFFSESDWIPVPKDWKLSIMQGKTYDTTGHIGAALWNEVSNRLNKYQFGSTKDRTAYPQGVAEPTPLYGSEYLTRARLGQGAFRVLVTEAYTRRCAITGERALPVLEAAHIKPFAQSGPNKINNGLLLRADLHILFDEGYITITDDLHIEVSRRIKEEYDNGKEYYTFRGKGLEVLPPKLIERPSKEFIQWHNQKIFRP